MRGLFSATLLVDGTCLAPLFVADDFLAFVGEGVRVGGFAVLVAIQPVYIS
jgi:hypothetical protein